jgi:hypothetical protein
MGRSAYVLIEWRSENWRPIQAASLGNGAAQLAIPSISTLWLGRLDRKRIQVHATLDVWPYSSHRLA